LVPARLRPRVGDEARDDGRDEDVEPAWKDAHGAEGRGMMVNLDPWP